MGVIHHDNFRYSRDYEDKKWMNNTDTNKAFSVIATFGFLCFPYYHHKSQIPVLFLLSNIGLLIPSSTKKQVFEQKYRTK